MKIALYARSIDKDLLPELKSFFSSLAEYGFEIYLYQDLLNHLKDKYSYTPPYAQCFSSYKELDRNIDFLISIGGDGTFLDTLSLVRDTKIPVIGINSGKLGFLASISKEDIPTAVDALYKGDYSIEKRSLLQLNSEDELFGDFNYALNDISIQKKSSEMITVHAYIDDQFLNTYWADGLIVATPTGSTAYSLSVGGPIVMPDSSDFIISPISPHNLTVRPIVVPDNGKITLVPAGRCSKYLVSIDHYSKIIDKAYTFHIQKADFSMHVLRLGTGNYYSTLRNKLMWGMDKRN
jgi:NAD+ kinase